MAMDNMVVHSEMMYHKEESIYVLNTSLNPYAEFRRLNRIACPQLNPAARTKHSNHVNCTQSQLSPLKSSDTSNNNNDAGASVSRSFQAKLKTLRSLGVCAADASGHPAVSSIHATAATASARMCSPAAAALQKLFNCASVANHMNGSYGCGTSKNNNGSGNGYTGSNNNNNNNKSKNYNYEYNDNDINGSNSINDCLSATRTDSYCYAGAMRANNNNNSNNSNHYHNRKSSSSSNNNSSIMNRKSASSSNSSISNYNSNIHNNNNSKPQKCTNIKSALIAKKTKFWKCLEEEKWRMPDSIEHLSTTNCERNRCSNNSCNFLKSSALFCDKPVTNSTKATSSLSSLSASKVATTFSAFVAAFQYNLNSKSNSSSNKNDHNNVHKINASDNHNKHNNCITTTTTTSTKTITPATTITTRRNDGILSSSQRPHPPTHQPSQLQQQQQQQQQPPSQFYKSNNWSEKHDSNNRKEAKTSSSELFKEAAELLGLACTFCDNCRCLDCQSGYFDCDDSDCSSEFSFMDEYDEYGTINATAAVVTATAATTTPFVTNNAYNTQAHYDNEGDYGKNQTKSDQQLYGNESQQQEQQQTQVEEEEEEDEERRQQQQCCHHNFNACEDDDACIKSSKKSKGDESVTVSARTTATTTTVTQGLVAEQVESLMSSHANTDTPLVATAGEAYESVLLGSNEKSQWPQQQQQLQQPDKQQMSDSDNCGECNEMIADGTAKKSKNKSINLIATQSVISPAATATTAVAATDETATTTTTTTKVADHQQQQQQQQQPQPQPQEVKEIDETMDHCVGFNELSLLEASNNFSDSCQDQAAGVDAGQQK